MSTLIERLRIKAGVMEMGERIAWGSDTALMREAAGKIEALEAQLESVGAGGVGAMMPKQLAVECYECGATHRPGENTLCPTFRPQQIAAPAAATGWKWVPLEPTAEMLQAGQDAPVSESDEDAPEDYKAVYRAMLAAAPHPQQIAGLDKDAEIAALKAERDALRKNDARYRFVVSSTDHSVAKWHDCEGWYAIEEVDLDADMREQAVIDAALAEYFERRGLPF